MNRCCKDNNKSFPVPSVEHYCFITRESQKGDTAWKKPIINLMLIKYYKASVRAKHLVFKVSSGKSFFDLWAAYYFYSSNLTCSEEEKEQLYYPRKSTLSVEK